MLTSNGSTTVAAALGKSLPSDVRTDFVAVAPVGINPMLLMVRPDLPVMAHEKPGKLRPTVERLHGAIDATIRSPDIARTFVELGADPQFGSPSECAGCVADDLAKWAGWPARPA